MLNDQEIASRLAALEGWTRQGNAIVKTYRFANYHETLAFVNALAWIAHRSDHHPDLEVGYGHCRVSFSTHSAGGMTDRDFANAARIDALFFAP
ncbi:4a-hydroxytetrahydrobiopterin dehydratase [Sulfuricystis multivorans]|uniref:4a-hydroxytetrahydrobiopterin dehydratase n=1 Tax=Sulfuricystis multivorans TaxID=2211108 RepID=UPI000F836440|nr:4a-hydroxytetrahydrobiopterin dehydratase [Sulfuricystis multivorans]